MRELTRVGMHSRSLMEWVLRIMANLLEVMRSQADAPQAAVVGLLTVVLTVWLWRAEPRRWVRWLGASALAAVVVQGVLGGITVLLKLPVAVAVAHAGLAEIFFCVTASIALVTSVSIVRPSTPRH